MLWSVAGSSCSGKTTAARACGTIPGVVVHDFDELGVPDGADLKWRQRGLETWLRRVLAYQAGDIDVVLLGQSPLGEVLAAPSAPLLDGLATCVLDVADDERVRRLERRDPGKWSPAQHEAFVKWGQWHRGHAADPGHHPEILTVGGWAEMAWDRWPSHAAEWPVPVFDTTGRTVDETSAAIRDWVTGRDRP
ncbi:hypothetical protein AB0M54_40705 [Actinoplanes sp. NPDC051470]|uniref:hypothetical protein n=1 Tax=unclassified Actinoplanes TaxID=2626549 RepID=UPI00343FF1F0